MKRIAIFVEGQTEQIFVEKLVGEIAGNHNVIVEIMKGHGGKQYPRQFMIIKADSVDSTKKYYILIINSATDNKVLSDMREQYDSLKSQGYETIIGLRDLYPESITNLERLKRATSSALSSLIDVRAKLIIAIMEVETWFIAEELHYSKVNSFLTLERINSVFNIDILKDDLQRGFAYKHPAELLDKIYRLEGIVYDKKQETVRNIVGKLDYANLYFEVNNRISSFNELINELDLFFTDII